MFIITENYIYENKLEIIWYFKKSNLWTVLKNYFPQWNNPKIGKFKYIYVCVYKNVKFGSINNEVERNQTGIFILFLPICYIVSCNRLLSHDAFPTLWYPENWWLKTPNLKAFSKRNRKKWWKTNVIKWNSSKILSFHISYLVIFFSEFSLI